MKPSISEAVGLPNTMVFQVYGSAFSGLSLLAIIHVSSVLDAPFLI